MSNKGILLTVGIIFLVVSVLALTIIFISSRYRDPYDSGGQAPLGDDGMRITCTSTITNNIGVNPFLTNVDCVKSADCNGGLFSFSRGLLFSDTGTVRLKAGNHVEASTNYEVEDFGGNIQVIQTTSCLNKLPVYVTVELVNDDGQTISSITKLIEP